MFKFSEINSQKIDWIKKFKEFVEIYVTDDNKKNLLLSYFTFVKIMKREIQPSDFANLYKELLKK